MKGSLDWPGVRSPRKEASSPDRNLPPWCPTPDHWILTTGHPVSPVLLTWAHGGEHVGRGPLKSRCYLCLPQSAETKLWNNFCSLHSTLLKPLKGILYINGKSLRWEGRNQRNPWEKCFSPSIHPSVTLIWKPIRDKAHKSFGKI